MNQDSNSIEWLKKVAKALHRSVQTGEQEALARVKAVYEDIREVPDSVISTEFPLMRAQHVVAVEHEFKDWASASRATQIRLKLAITMYKEPLLNDFGIGM